MTSQARGVVAAGHEATVAAAADVLREGGNAFDAIVAAHFAACVCEPVLASLGGGGFLLARPAAGRQLVYDFFVHTPRVRRPAAAVDFRRILADFGTTQQPFHIGLGAIATPGSVRGMFGVHRDLCTVPMRELVQPAVALAREGVQVNHLQAYIFSIVQAILTATPGAQAVFASRRQPGELLQEGERQQRPVLADFMEVLAREGEELFYRGEVAQAIARSSEQGGGHLTLDDLGSYELIRRQPLRVDYRGAHIDINPPPSSGGILVAFALQLLAASDLDQLRWGTAEQLALLARVMELSDQARLDAGLGGAAGSPSLALLDERMLSIYQQQIRDRARAHRGTTHLSVMDAAGNTASLTVTNGEGCGSLVPDTGIMLNNMLGEEDLHPEGFHQWPANQRLTSMMAPGILELPDEGRVVAFGSGGSNRIRTAILQVIANLVDARMGLAEAVHHPRVHYEGGELSVEPGFAEPELGRLCDQFPQHQLWDEQNLFFGGAHVVERQGDDFKAVGDPRRGGVGVVVAGA